VSRRGERDPGTDAAEDARTATGAPRVFDSAEGFLTPLTVADLDSATASLANAIESARQSTRDSLAGSLRAADAQQTALGGLGKQLANQNRALTAGLRQNQGLASFGATLAKQNTAIDATGTLAEHALTAQRLIRSFELPQSYVARSSAPRFSPPQPGVSTLGVTIPLRPSQPRR
jgi:hypothetical protein